MPTRKVEISTSTIFRFILIILGLVFLYMISDVLLMLFFAFIIAAGVEAPVSWMHRKGLKRIFGVIIVYLISFLILAGIIYLVIPPLVSQIKALANNLPEISQRFGLGLEAAQQKYQGFEGILNNIANKFESITPNIFQTTFSFFGGVFSAIMIVVISFYLAVQERGIKKFLVSVTPKDHRDYVTDLVHRIEGKLGSWIRGQLLLMVLVAVLTYIGLSLLGIKYALVLALLAGLLEVVPYIGPIISAIPAIILAFFQSPFLALIVAIVYYAIQQLENYVLAPQIMRKALGLNPVVIIVALLVGAKIAGMLGMIIAVPLAAVFSVFLSDIFRGKKEEL